MPKILQPGALLQARDPDDYNHCFFAILLATVEITEELTSYAIAKMSPRKRGESKTCLVCFYEDMPYQIIRNLEIEELLTHDCAQVREWFAFVVKQLETGLPEEAIYNQVGVFIEKEKALMRVANRAVAKQKKEKESSQQNTYKILFEKMMQERTKKIGEDQAAYDFSKNKAWTMDTGSLPTKYISENHLIDNTLLSNSKLRL